MKIVPIILALIFFLGCKSSYPVTGYESSIQKKAIADKGMVVSGHPLASKVGIEVMKQGGNAVDASIATQLALAVVYTRAGNIGGGGFMVYRSAAGEINTLDF